MKRLYLLIFCILTFSGVIAQQQKNKYANLKFNKSGKEKDIFLKKQWWLGLKGGANISKPVVMKKYSVIAPANYDASDSEKQYDSYRQIGTQITIEATYYYRGFNASFQPTYRHIGFDYENRYSWESSVESRRLDMDFKQKQRIDYIDLPILLKYERGISKIRPYIQAGFYFSHRVNATKRLEVTKTDYASGGANETHDSPIIVGASDLFAKNHWGILGGAGLNYNVGNVRLNFDIQYKHGLSNISSTENRFGNDRLSGVGDALDDLRLNNLAVSLGCLFPLRFLERDFKSLDKK
jgi:outer membrane protein W